MPTPTGLSLPEWVGAPAFRECFPDNTCVCSCCGVEVLPRYQDRHAMWHMTSLTLSSIITARLINDSPNVTAR